MSPTKMPTLRRGPNHQQQPQQKGTQTLFHKFCIDNVRNKRNESNMNCFFYFRFCLIIVKKKTEFSYIWPIWTKIVQ